MDRKTIEKSKRMWELLRDLPELTKQEAWRKIAGPKENCPLHICYFCEEFFSEKEDRLVCVNKCSLNLASKYIAPTPYFQKSSSSLFCLTGYYDMWRLTSILFKPIFADSIVKMHDIVLWDYPDENNSVTNDQ